MIDPAKLSQNGQISEFSLPSMVRVAGLFSVCTHMCCFAVSGPCVQWSPLVGRKAVCVWVISVFTAPGGLPCTRHPIFSLRVGARLLRFSCLCSVRVSAWVGDRWVHLLRAPLVLPSSPSFRPLARSACSSSSPLLPGFLVRSTLRLALHHGLMALVPSAAAYG